jgi:hypothetical protein
MGIQGAALFGLLLAGASLARATEPGRVVLHRASRGHATIEAVGHGAGAARLRIGRVDGGVGVLVVRAGTVFAGDGVVQDMATTTETVIVLGTEPTRVVDLPAVCLHFHRPPPHAAVGLRVAGFLPDRRLRRLFKVIDHERPSHVAAQLAVWALTDRPTREAVDRVVRRRLVPALPSVPALDPADFREARALLARASIAVSADAFYPASVDGR